MNTKETIQLLDDLIEYYLDFINQFKESDYNYGMDILIDNNVHLGICHLLVKRFEKAHDFNPYWIKRNAKYDGYWFKVPLACGRSETVIKALEYRVNILRKELYHHKKWRFLAKYVKIT